MIVYPGMEDQNQFIGNLYFLYLESGILHLNF